MKSQVVSLFKIKKNGDLGGPAGVLFSTIVMFLLAQLAAAFIIGVILALTHNADQAKYLFDHSAAWQFGFIFIAEALAVALVLAILKLRRVKIGFIGLGRRFKVSDLKHAALGVLSFYGLLIIVSILIGIFLPGINPQQKQDLGFNNLVVLSDNIFAFVGLVLLPPLGEEIMIRGYLFSGLRARINYWQAAIITSLLFGFAHLEIGSGGPLVWAAAIDTFILSMVLVSLRERTGALYAGMIVHMLNNLVAFSVHYH